MRILFFVAFLFATHVLCLAQWNTTGNNIYNTNSGNVGIGTSAPDGLQVNIPLSTETSMGVDNVRIGTLGTPRIIFDKAGFTTFEIDNASGRFRIFNPGVERFTLTSDGNVGIGTSNPQSKLHVAGGGYFQGGRLVQQGDIPNDNNAAFWNYSSSGYGLYSQGGGGGRYAFHFLNQEGTTILYGKGNGHVGIGTYYPDSKLTVKR